MISKKQARLRRARRGRMKMRELGVSRLTVNRSPRHIYAQVLSADGANVLAQASTLDKSLREGATGNVEAAAKVGALVAERAQAAGVSQVAFDRSGYKFHGRVKALAEAAREGGLEF
ncbi:MAG: 50S ribosomal protein L18 [Gammaproteobacteria bacterium]|nr:50S ribosomal protein L18 [Gammaproteobacteria bacterium]MYE85638.1 50S ribosomal protein L18 [Gammaproteobacteria bacterium]MYF13034.1 50S ribosomal protein L18 [Gammaproteobacteria bacterium]MYH17081.1 50S ribosomal protein L18 [Gammaproteobacteria bacterium]MYK81466.1 50S ribosomal protein L18 [Gammaproteobacteria bacterium]